MFIVDFRNTLVSKYCFSVMNNNDVDVVYIYSHFVQYVNYLCYLKVESEDKEYVDEFLIDSENIEVVDNALLVKWTMGEISTQCKKINIQLEFRESNAENSKIAQTKIVSIVLADTIDTSEGSKRLYPNILKYLQEQIDTLKDDSVAGFTMSYVSDVLTINLKNANDESVAQLQVNIPTDNKVDKIAGKGLSTNDFTDALKNKLDGIMAGAQVNVIEGVKVDGVELTPDENKKVNITNKVTKTDNANKVYGTDGSGNQTTMPVDNVEGKDGNVARRKQTSGQVSVPTTPVANDDATAKQYVDTFGKTIELSIDSTTYVLTARLKDANGNVLNTQQVDLPLESVVVSGSYDSATQSIILTLQNGSTITIPVAGLISGLVSQTDFDALALRVTTAEGNIITLGNTKVNYSDITISGGFVIAITKNGSTYPIAEVVNISATPVVVQHTSDLPAQNDGNLYVVLDNGYLYAWSNGWQQLYEYTSDLLTITEVTAGEVIYSYISDKGHSNRPIQVESAVRDGEGNIINDTYAKKVGYEPQLRVGTADNIYSNRTIDEPETACPPIVMGTTGGDAEIKTGIENFEYMEGKSKKFNQLLKDNANISNQAVGATGTLANGLITMTGTSANASTWSANILADNVKGVLGHKYLRVFNVLKNTNNTSNIHIYIREGSNVVSISKANALVGDYSDIWTSTLNFTSYETGFRTAIGDTIDIKVRVMLIDLTAIYGAGNEPTSVEDFKKDYPLDYYAYNAGEILSAKASKLISRGRQQWDEQWELGGYNNTTGEKIANNNTIRNKDIIRVLPNTKYYVKKGTSSSLVVLEYDINGNFIKPIHPFNDDGTFTTYANSCYVNFYCLGTTYNHDITISVYFEDGEGYDKYYSYSAQEVTLPNIELRSVPDYTNGGEIKDIAYAQGGGKRRLGYVDLSTLTWTYNSTYNWFYTNSLASSIKPLSSNYQKANMLAGKYVTTKFADAGDKIINQQEGTYIYVRDNSLSPTDTPTGYLLYELAEETELTENQGWVEQVLVDNYGTLEFVTDPQQVPQVEQPYYIEYTIDLVEFLDSSYTRAGGDAGNFALVEEVEQAKEEIEEALKNGSLKPANSELADNFTPYDEDSGEEQNAPFINQGTGCGNGETSVDTGSVALMRKKEGNLVIGNQLLQYTDFRNSNLTYSFNGNMVTITNNTQNELNNPELLRFTPYSIVNGHKYLMFKGNKQDVFRFWGSNQSISFTQNYDIVTANVTFNDGFQVYYIGTLASGASITFGTCLIDLTQMFGSNDNIPAYLLAHPEAFFNYYQGSLAYNVGTPIVSNATTLKTIGRNLFNKDDVEDGYIDDSSGIEVLVSGYKHSKYIEVIPNTPYYFRTLLTSHSWGAWYDKDKNFISGFSGWAYNSNQLVSPSNAKYVRFTCQCPDHTPSDREIVISLYYEGESGYDQYYPYKVLSEVNTGNEVLRSAGSVRDYKEPNGTIHRLVGRVDLGDLTWSKSTLSDNVFYAELSTKPHSDVQRMNMLCAKYTQTRYTGISDMHDVAPDKSIEVNTGGSHIYVKDTSYDNAQTFKQAMTGVYLFYELAEETTEEGTPFAENLDIDDFGSMMFGGTDFNGIPMGNEIFYPVDYKASLDTLINHCDGDMERIVLDTDLEESETARDSVDNILLEQNKGVMRTILADKYSLNFGDIEVIDMGNLSYTAFVVNGATCFYSSVISNMKTGANKAISTKFKYVGYRTSIQNDLEFGYFNEVDRQFIFRLDGITNNTAFKNAMKGVLLAYEKAS